MYARDDDDDDDDRLCGRGAGVKVAGDITHAQDDGREPVGDF